MLLLHKMFINFNQIKYSLTMIRKHYEFIRYLKKSESEFSIDKRKVICPLYKIKLYRG